MEKEETRQQHYELPASSELEREIAREYLRGYGKDLYLDGFGHFLFTDRAAPKNITDEGNPNIDTNKYDTAFLELYSLALAKAQLAVSSAAEDSRKVILERVLQLPVQDDFFINELEKRENWKKYVNVESVAAWYDDKRRAAMRGYSEAVAEKQHAIEHPKKSKKWLYAIGIPFALTLFAGAVSQIALYFQAAGLKEEAKKEISAAKDDFMVQADILLTEKEQHYTLQLYDFADRIDPPKDEEDKSAKRGMPLADRIGTALSSYEDKLIEKGEIRYRQVAEENASQVGEDIIRRINKGEIDVSQILIKYLGSEKK